MDSAQSAAADRRIRRHSADLLPGAGASGPAGRRAEPNVGFTPPAATTKKMVIRNIYTGPPSRFLAAVLHITLACTLVSSYIIPPTYSKIFSRSAPSPLVRPCTLAQRASFVSRWRIKSNQLYMSTQTVSSDAAQISEKVRTFLNRIPGGTSLRALESADRAWSSVRSTDFTKPPATPAVTEQKGKLLQSGSKPDFDVAICGGTLGIFVGAALARKGWRVAVIEQVFDGILDNSRSVSLASE